MTDRASVLVADDDSVTGEALADILGGKFLGLPASSDDAAIEQWVTELRRIGSTLAESTLLVNAHVRLSSYRADCLGLRIVDELIIALGLEAPCPVIYSFYDGDTLEAWLGRQQRDLSKPWADMPVRFRECGLPWREFVLHVPQTLEGIAEKVENARRQWRQLSASDRCTLQRETAEAYAERTHKQMRHGRTFFSSRLRPATRFLLGALHVANRRDQVLDCIVSLANPERRSDVRELLSTPRHKRLLDLSRVDATRIPNGLRFLLIDDELCGSGWEEALKTALGCDVTGLETLRSPVDELDLTQYDAVLLDYAFPDRTSADWLRQIKAQYPEVPVVMFTMSDRAEVALWCLQHGATAYYVKEPYEPLMRSSREHFARFACDILARFDSLDFGRALGLWRARSGEGTRVRSIIRRIHFELRGKIAAADRRIAPLGRGSIQWHLGQVCRLLLGNLEDLYLSRGASLSLGSHGGTALPREAEVARARLCHHAQAALELLAVSRAIEHEARTNAGWQSDVDSQNSFVDSFFAAEGGWRGRCRALAQSGYYPRCKNCESTKWGDRSGDPWGDLEGISHWQVFLPGVSRPDVSRTLDLLEKVVVRCCENLPPNTVESSPPEIVALREAPPPQPETKTADHGLTAELGADDLFSGMCEAAGCDGDRESVLSAISAAETAGKVPNASTIGQWLALLNPTVRAEQAVAAAADKTAVKYLRRCPRLLILDDQPASRFVTVLRLILGYVAPGVTVEAATPTAMPANCEEYGLVLLDLDWGTPQDTHSASGLEWLRKFRSETKCWWLPVCVLTAKVDSIGLRSAFSAGAVGYIAKRLGGRKPKECFEYVLHELSRLTAIAPHLKRLQACEPQIRHIWHQDINLKCWESQVAFAPQRFFNRHLRMREYPGSVVDSLDAVGSAVSSALLSAWCHLYLNATRTQRADVWLEQLFGQVTGQTKRVFLRAAAVDMRCAIEPLALAAQQVVPSIDNPHGRAGKVLSDMLKPGRHTRVLPFIGAMEEVIKLGNDLEHSRPFPERITTRADGQERSELEGCIAELEKACNATTEFVSWFSRQRPVR